MSLLRCTAYNYCVLRILNVKIVFFVLYTFDEKTTTQKATFPRYFFNWGKVKVKTRVVKKD